MKIYIIGIGGIGVSALAQYYLAKGHQVSGSDLAASEITRLLQAQGARLLAGEHKAENVPVDVELVIYSPAVRQGNPELKTAREQRIKRLSYPQALGELTKQYFTIAVSGTHGKSTTTAMLSLVMIKAGLDPTVIIGTKLKEFNNSNFRLGNKAPDSKQYLVIEADEWGRSFLNYWPKMIVLTNIEKEHMDTYKDMNDVLGTYREYIGHLPEEGILIANGEDDNIKRIFNFQFSPNQSRSWRHGTGQAIFNKFSIFNFQFSESKDRKKLGKILQVPGEHNVKNALAALTAARALGIKDDVLFKALAEYKGSWRRFEEKDSSAFGLRMTVVSDYAHHPTEVKATLEAARGKYPKKKIWCVFQPHQYQRTYYLFDEFVNVFEQALDRGTADKIILTDIYDVAGRESEEIREKVSAQKLVGAVKESAPNVDVGYLPQEKIVDYLKQNLKGGEVVIIMGAGSIYNLLEEF